MNVGIGVFVLTEASALVPMQAAIRYAARLCSRCAQLRGLPRTAAGYGYG
jgi:hypothetical protein